VSVNAVHGQLADAYRRLAELDWRYYLLGDPAAPDEIAALQAQLRHLHDAIPTPRSYLFCRGLVETDAEVMQLRHQADAVTGEIVRGTKESERTEHRRLLTGALAPLVQQLFRRRNALARGLGSETYADLLLGSMSIGRAELTHWLRDAVGAFSCPEPGPDDTWLTYHATADAAEREGESRIRWSEEVLGEVCAAVGVDPTVASSPPAGIFLPGWCLSVSRPDDVRLVLSTREDTVSLRLVLHELGHYLHYTAPAPEDWPFTAPPPPFDETLAGVLESAGDSPAFDHLLVCRASEAGRAARQAKLRQWAASARFELLAYKADGEGLDALWAEVVRPTGLRPTVPGEWSLDGFLVDDPVYRFSYVLGACWVAREEPRLRGLSLRQVADLVRQLSAAAYSVPWRPVLGLEVHLPRT